MFEEEGLLNRCLRSTWEDHAVAPASLSAKAAPALIVGVGRRASGEGTCKRGGLTVAQSFEVLRCTICGGQEVSPPFLAR